MATKLLTGVSRYTREIPVDRVSGEEVVVCPLFPIETRIARGEAVRIVNVQARFEKANAPPLLFARSPSV
jgi:hypothetical protein